MSMKSSSSSDLSLDSLDVELKEKKATKEIYSTNGDTILVPFYEKDVLIKIDKPQMKIFNRKLTRSKAGQHNKKEETYAKSYLVNKNTKNKYGKPSYLQAFRQRFPPDFDSNNKNVEEIRSISPEFGDTERESISDSEASPNRDFYETEAYNDIYYEKIMNQEITDASNRNFEQDQGTEDSNPLNVYIINNLKSISELTQPRRRSRRASVEPIRNIRLGGLGPDMENIKPRLERAKSLQRYSEKVRMENRLKIYKKSVQDDANKSDKVIGGKQKTVRAEYEPSYLVNKELRGRKSSQKESKSASARNGRSNHNQVDGPETYLARKEKRNGLKKEYLMRGTSAPQNMRPNFKGSKKKQGNAEKIDLEKNKKETSERVNKAPNFDALKLLEEKHRMYQEKIKQFQMCHPLDR